MDSVSSAIAAAYLSSLAKPATARYIPLVQTLAADFTLRPENTAALASAGIANPAELLLTLDDLPSILPRSLHYLLVDHNKLAERYGGANGQVVGVIDHHDDEGFHAGVQPRLIQVVGSCSTLVTSYFSIRVPTVAEWPEEVADLLISALLIDTSLKPLPKGKATALDLEMLQFLIPRSTVKGNLNALVALTEANTQLLQIKSDVGSMSARDLLRRDYKQYSFGATTPILYGLSTVPLGFADWKRDWKAIVHEAHDWMAAQNLTFLGILTTYNKPTKADGSKGKHMRQLMLVAAGDQVLPLFTQLAGSKDLELTELAGGPDWKVWQQGNDKATRKQVAPLILATLQNMLGK